MKRAMDWQVTLTFRPLRAFARVAFLAFVVVFLLPIARMSTASDAPKTIAQLSRENAVAAVDRVIGTRMAYLDGARRQQLGVTIVDESLSCGLDPLFTMAVGDVESRLDHEAVSPTGARGLYQVLPSTWDREVKRRGLGRLEKFNVVHNAKVGIGYLCLLSKTFKRPDSLLLAYNQGPGGASAILAKNATPTDEASMYAAKVWKSYRTILAGFWLPNDPKSMRQFYRAPESTVYNPLAGYSSDVRGADRAPAKYPAPKQPVRKASKTKTVQAVAMAGP